MSRPGQSHVDGYRWSQIVTTSPNSDSRRRFPMCLHRTRRRQCGPPGLRRNGSRQMSATATCTAGGPADHNNRIVGNHRSNVPARLSRPAQDFVSRRYRCAVGRGAARIPAACAVAQQGRSGESCGAVRRRFANASRWPKRLGCERCYLLVPRTTRMPNTATIPRIASSMRSPRNAIEPAYPPYSWMLEDVQLRREAAAGRMDQALTVGCHFSL